jgi:hypothetical protein
MIKSHVLLPVLFITDVFWMDNASVVGVVVDTGGAIRDVDGMEEDNNDILIRCELFRDRRSDRTDSLSDESRLFSN